MELIHILLKALFAGIAGLGFAMIFNVPRRTLIPITVIATVGGGVKFGLLFYGLSIVWASFFAGLIVGLLSVPFAKKWYCPPLVLAIPGVIPMVPGAYIYNMILGMIQIATTADVLSPQVVVDTVHNGLLSLFILVGISVGAGMPVIISRSQIMTSIEKH